MLLIKLTNGREIKAASFTLAADHFHVIDADGKREAYSRDAIDSIGEVGHPEVVVFPIEYGPDHLLLARQALNLSTFFMDRLIHPDGGPHTNTFTESDLQADAQNIARYFDCH